MIETFAVKVGEFEGPLELLLELVEERELQINQVSLATVADSFIEHLKKIPQTHRLDGQAEMNILGNFVVIASTLILIKSLSLLPTLAVTGEEEEQIGDLERRLKLYQIVRQTMPQLQKALAGPAIFYRDSRGRVINPVFSPTAEITLTNLKLVMERLIRDLPKAETLPTTTVKKLISIEAVINDLTHRVQTALSMSFNDFVKDKQEKVNVIVSFLALLELFKQGLVNITQTEHFADIKIETKDSNIPRYG
ncbi:MAG: segregation/condensation protein A [Candidatus Vogelbacteria bacterium]